MRNNQLVLLTVVLSAWVLSACGTDDSPLEQVEDVFAQVSDTTADIVDVPPDAGAEPDTDGCEADEDCRIAGGCITEYACVDGACQVTVLPAGTPCAIGCDTGRCGAGGACADLTPMQCAEKDGSTCTIPTCVVTPGATALDSEGHCTEIVIEDGKPPYASSECFTGAVCSSGQIDSANAAPTQLALECEAMGADVDPFGCIDHYVCVGADEKCRPVVRPDGTQCWADETGVPGATCVGRSCVEGACVDSEAFDVVCGGDDYPADCDDECRGCTALTCHWIDDPAAVGAAAKRVRYCRPAARVGEPCAADACKTTQQCGFGSQGEGPLGKETLGVCAGGQDKTPAQCLEDAGKPPLSCLLAGTTCNAQLGGCQFEQDVMDKWCWPPEGLCWEKAATFCTHLDSGDLWDDATGCHTAWVDLDCDDGNACTVGQCKPELSDFVCHFTLLSGSPCDDGDPCLVGESCDAGQCLGGLAKCDDGDACNGLESCSVEGVCDDETPLDCDDANPCTTDSCDAVTGCANSFNTLPCDDGDPCSLKSACSDGECVVTQINSCEDGDPCTENLCDSKTVDGCLNPVVPNATPCPGGICIKGDCTCSPQCDGSTCGGDGCGGACECADGVDCVAGVCGGGGDLDGKYFITANPPDQTCGGLPCSFIPFYIDLVFTETTATGVGKILLPDQTLTIDYFGARSGDDFSMEGTYVYSSLFGDEAHVETWICALGPPGQFSGTMVDVFNGFLGPASVNWNIIGVKQ